MQIEGRLRRGHRTVASIAQHASRRILGEQEEIAAGLALLQALLGQLDRKCDLGRRKKSGGRDDLPDRGDVALSKLAAEAESPRSARPHGGAYARAAT